MRVCRWILVGEVIHHHCVRTITESDAIQFFVVRGSGGQCSDKRSALRRGSADDVEAPGASGNDNVTQWMGRVDAAAPK